MENKDIFSEKLMFVNKLSVPMINDPIGIRIYWFQAHSYEHDTSVFYFKSHVHTFNEAHFMLQGNMKYEINGQEFVVSKGEFIMIPANTIHSQICCSNDLIKLSLSFEIITDAQNPLSQIICERLSLSPVLHQTLSSEMVSAIDLICSNAKKALPLTSFNIRNEIFLLITELYYVASNSIDKIIISSSDGNATDSRYILAKKFIDDNISLKLKTGDVANHVHISAKQLNRIFFKYKKMSVFDYISEQKSIMAKELLITTDLSLQNISEKLGFADEFYFNRYFTKKEGITPMKFRKINGNVIKNKKNGELKK